MDPDSANAYARRGFILAGLCGVGAAWASLHWPAVLTAAQHAAQRHHPKFVKVMQSGVAAAPVFQPLPTGHELIQGFLTRCRLGHPSALLQPSPAGQLHGSTNAGSIAFSNAIALRSLVPLFPVFPPLP